MAIWFVSSSTGSDSNAGTISQPFASIAHARSVAAQGDTINLKGGDTFSESNAFTVGVTIQNYGTGQATINGLISAQTLSFTACSGITLTDLILSNPAGAGTVIQCVEINNTSGTNLAGGVTITGCTVTGGQSGIITNGSLTNITMSGNTVTGSASRGINIAAASSFNSNVQITNNTVFNIPGYNSTGITGIGICVQNANSSPQSNISGNLVHDVASESNGAAGGGGCIQLNACTGTVISGNVTYNAFQSINGHDGAGIDIDTGNIGCSIIGNIVYDCDGAGLFYFGSTDTTETSVIAFNLAVNTGRLTANEDGLSLSGTGACDAYNNTIINQAGTNSALGFFATSSNTANKKIYNNIFYTPSGAASVNIPTITTPFDLQGNAYGSGTTFLCLVTNGTTYNTLAAFRTGTGMESSGHGFSLTGNPCIAPSPIPAITSVGTFRLAYDYSLPAGSPLLGGGLNLTSLFGITLPATDLLGNAISPTNLSVGAINIVKPPAYTWEFVQATSLEGPSAATTISKAFQHPVTAGNLLAALVTCESAVTPTFTDSASDSYTTAIEEESLTILAFTKATASGALTVTATVGSSQFLDLAIGDWKPPLGAIFSLGNTEPGFANGSTAVSLPSVTTTLPAAVIMGSSLAVNGDPSQTVTPGSGMTLRTMQPGAFLSPGVFLQDNLPASSSPVPLTATLSSAVNWVGVGAAFPSPLPPYSILGPTSGAVGR